MDAHAMRIYTPATRPGADAHSLYPGRTLHQTAAEVRSPGRILPFILTALVRQREEAGVNFEV